MATDENEENPITDDVKKNKLKARLDVFRRSAITAQDEANDPAAYTAAATNGYWGPWM